MFFDDALIPDSIILDGYTAYRCVARSVIEEQVFGRNRLQAAEQCRRKKICGIKAADERIIGEDFIDTVINS